MSIPSRPLVIAHRGARRWAPENTLAAFAEARRLGAHGVELDVRRSADGVLVVHHDPVIPEVGLIAAQPWSALRRAEPDLVTLSAALDACRGLLVDVEVKHLPTDPDFDPDYRAAIAVAELLVARAQAAAQAAAANPAAPADTVVVTSFDDSALARVHGATAGLRTGLLGIAPPSEAEITRAVALHAAWYLPWVVSLPTEVPALVEIVVMARDFGLDVVPWTVNDEPVLAALGRAGVHGVVTDFPDVAGRVLGQR